MQPNDDFEIQSKLLKTWMSIAAIAEMCGVDSRIVWDAIRRNAALWDLEQTEAWVDGHNRSNFVRLRKKVKTMMILGVTIPVIEAA